MNFINVKNKIACVFTFICLQFGIEQKIEAQNIGSRSANGLAPTELKAFKMTTGPVSGDVGLFSGALDLKHHVGTIKGTNGLSFDLNMNYNSNIPVSNNQNI